MKKLLAFDYGASSGRGMLGFYDGKKLELEEVHRFLNEPVMINKEFHWDFLRLFHEMKQGMIKCVAEGHNDIDSIGVDTWGVDFGLLDKNGGLISNPFHYRDTRTDGLVEELDKKIGNKFIYDTTGIQFMQINTLYQLYAMKKNNPEIFENTKDLLFMPDLFNYFLTGKKKAEFSIASTSQIYNPTKNDWAHEILNKLDIDASILPSIIESATLLGGLSEEVKEETGLNNGKVIAVAGHDTGCAVASVPEIEDRDYIYLSSGTWSLMGIESDQAIINDKAFKYNITNEGGVEHKFRVLKNIMGLWVYQECRRYWNREKGANYGFDELEADAAKQKKFESFIDPDDNLFLAPGDMPKKVQKYCKDTNQKVPETKGEIVLTIMQSLAMKYREVSRQLDDLDNKNHPIIHIVGGGCKNVMLSQYTADASGKTVIAGPIEATATGNIITQLIALGDLKNLKEARELVHNSFDTKVYEPKEKQMWDDAYGKYLKATRKD